MKEKKEKKEKNEKKSRISDENTTKMDRIIEHPSHGKI